MRMDIDFDKRTIMVETPVMVEELERFIKEFNVDKKFVIIFDPQQIFLKTTNWNPIKKHIDHPIQKPWDYVFSKKKSFWVIVHLKDGRRIGGRFGTNSFASSYPYEEQIYLEEVWKLDDKGAFVEAIERSKGIIIFGNDISAVELFE